MIPEESYAEYHERVNKPEPFAVTDDRSADWVVRKITQYQQAIDANKQTAARERQQIDDWLAVVNGDAEKSIDWLAELLRPYLEFRLPDQRTKTLKLPGGTVSLRKPDAEFSIDGEKVTAENPELLEFVRRSNPDFLKIKETVDWSALKTMLIATESGRVMTTDGEIVDFMAAWQPPDKINVKGVK